MKNNNKGVIILLIIIILILATLFILFATNTIFFNASSKNNHSENTTTNNQENSNVTNKENNKAYNYSEMKGLYKFETEILTDESGNKYRATYNLYLYENGTFIYKLSTMAPFGYMGNYIIEDNKIKLNYLFSTNSGASIKITKGSKNLAINSNNSITDENQPINTINLTNITLTKTNETEENKFITDGNDFEKILNNYNIENNEN